MNQTTFDSNYREDIDKKIKEVEAKKVSKPELDDKSHFLKLVRNQELSVVDIDEKFIKLFRASTNIHSIKNVDKQIIYKFPSEIMFANNITSIFIDTVTMSRKGDTYTFITSLGKLREEFQKVSGFSADKTVVLQELLRMNGFDELIESLDRVKINIKPTENTMGELVLFTTLTHEPSKDELIAIFIEFSKIVEVYKHLLHYILDLTEKTNPNVYLGIKDSSIFKQVDLSKYTGKRSPEPKFDFYF